MHKLSYLPLLFFSLSLTAQSQEVNPFVSNPNINPSPLKTVEAGGKGVFSFTAGNSGTETLKKLKGRYITLQIQLSFGEPSASDPLQALKGTFKSYFDWEYHNGRYEGMQKESVPAKFSGSITIDYRVTRNSEQNSPGNGFTASIKNVKYSSNINKDDDIRLYTWTEREKVIECTAPHAPVPGMITNPTCAVRSGKVVINGLPSSGQWLLLSNPAGVRLQGTGPTATVSGLMPGSYTFTVSNSAGCVSASSGTVVISAVPDSPVLKITNPPAVCKPAQVDLSSPSITAGSPAGLSFSYWINQNATIPLNNTNISTGGTYYIRGTNSLSCYDVKPVTVTIVENPIADAGPDQVLEYDFTVSLTGNTLLDGETGTWSAVNSAGNILDPSSPLSQVTDLNLGNNLFAWTVDNGKCPSVSDTVLIVVNDLFIPTLITPNNDGRNDFFILKGTEKWSGNSLIVFDRRGITVYRNEDYQNEWGGTDNDGKPLPDDTYFYIFIENNKPRKGYLVIRR